jgi:hypothetical protein
MEEKPKSNPVRQPKKIVVEVDFTKTQHKVEFYKYVSDCEPALTVYLPYRTLARITKYIRFRRKSIGEDIRKAPTGLTVIYHLA